MTDRLRLLTTSSAVEGNQDRAAELAEFPEVPESPFGAPSYFFRVLKRRGEIKKETEAARVIADEARRALDRAIAGAATGSVSEGVDEDRRRQETERRALDDEERRAKEELANLDAARGRVEAKLRRTEIELRNLTNLIERKA